MSRRRRRVVEIALGSIASVALVLLILTAAGAVTLPGLNGGDNDASLSLDESRSGFLIVLRVRIVLSVEKCFDRQLSAISGCDCSRHTARPRTCWNYGGTCHRKGSGV